MANLIITIISIALVAIAALMGAYYGGTAFLNGQAKANANASVSQGEQQVAAWSVYASDRSGSWTLSSISSLSATSPAAYLTTSPVAPAGAAASTGISAWSLVNLSDISGGTSATFNGVYFQLVSTTSGATVCSTVSQMIGGPSASPALTSVANNLLQANTGHKFDCVFVDTSASVFPTTGADPMYIYYRAY